MKLPPKVGQVFEKNNLRREVVEIVHVNDSVHAANYSVIWKRPKGYGCESHLIWHEGWWGWAASAKLVIKADIRI